MRFERRSKLMPSHRGRWPRLPLQRKAHRVVALPPEVRGDDIKQSEDSAHLHQQPAIHNGLSRTQRGIERNGARGGVPAKQIRIGLP